MKKTLLTLLFAFAIMVSANAQDKLWKVVSPERLSALEKFERATTPSEYKLFNLNFNELKADLATAPLDSDGIISNTLISFPNSKGEMALYRIYEAPVMEKGLSDKFPDLKSYIGQGIDDKTASIRFSVTLFGLHVMSTSGNDGTFYIDTYTKDLNNYIVYNRKNISTSRTFSCLVEDDHEEITQQRSSTYAQKASDGLFRQYRMAMACTIEYAAFHINAAGLGSGTLVQQKAAVLSAMTVTMTRVNGVYEKDMSLRMNLVANNDLLIFITSDNFSNDTASALINESQAEIDAIIGFSNYDIGHTVSTGGGGLAQRPSVCVAGKARGITGSPSPVGDPYDIDFVAHEVGHQFGGSHTFNGVGGNCTLGTRSASTAVEPGSGSTIMAYAGICTGIDVQGNSDAYFHAISIGEMVAHITGAGNCVTGTANGNSTPVVNAGADYTIPKGTPFMLTGTATDANGDTLTYCWEQTNTGISTATATPTSTSGPNFRSFNPTTSPTRYFPSMPLVLNGNLTSNWEVLSNVARTMNFALTVRDNRTPNGGQTQRDNMNVTIDAARGPLTVTSQNTNGIVWTPGSTQTITWTVNGTNNSVGGNNVTILLSTDNGVTFPTVLLASTTNSGSASITVPNVTAANCRVMVKAAANIFFNVNLKNIAIGNYTYQNQNVCNDYTYNLNSAITESSTQYSGFSLPIADSFTISDVNVELNATHPNIGTVQFAISSPTGYAVTPTPVLSRLYRANGASCPSGANLHKTFDMSGTAINCANTTDNAVTLPSDDISTANYNGTNSQGNWYIWFVDLNTTDGLTGTINTLRLNLCYSQLVPVLANDSFGLENFTIYPNPNNGNFTVQFDSNSGNNVKVGVHDMRGRLVFEKNYQNTGTFNQNVQLNNVQSGIYMVTVQDGERKEVKKIVIN